LAVLALAGCDGQQYVSPDTVALSVTSDETGSDLLSHCDFVPVLPGAEVTSSFVVDPPLSATLSITRSSVSVTFEGTAPGTPPFVVAAAVVQQGKQIAPEPPAGYTVTLSPGCTPSE
jgi:hypothetical protein